MTPPDFDPPPPGRRTPLRTSDPPGPIDYIVEELLPAGRLTILAAAPGAGKSLLAMSVATHAALRLPLLGRETRPGRVLYLDYETDVDVLRRTAARILAGVGRTLDDASLDNVVVYEPNLPLSMPSGLSEVRTVVERERPDLVIIDSLSLGSSGADVSSSQDMTPALIGLSHLGVAVLALDHVTKSAASGQSAPTPIGTVLKTAAARAVLVLTSGKAGYMLSATKWNLGAMPPPLRFGIEFEGSEGPIRFYLNDDSSAVSETGTLGESEQLTLEVLVDLFDATGALVPLAEIVRRREERSGKAMKQTTVANHLSRLKTAGLVSNPSWGMWLPIR